MRQVNDAKEDKKVLPSLMKELFTSSVDVVNFIRRKGEVCPVMSAGQIVTGRKMVIPPYPPGSYVYAVYGNHTNSIDNMRTFDALYLRPNKEGGGTLCVQYPYQQKEFNVQGYWIKQKADSYV